MTTDAPPSVPDGGTSDGGPDAPTDVVAALRNEQRRALVDALLEEGGDLTLVTLASKLTTGDDASLPETVIELHDVHLPELTECGVVEFDEDTGQVSLLVSRETATAALEAATDTGTDTDTDPDAGDE